MSELRLEHWFVVAIFGVVIGTLSAGFNRCATPAECIEVCASHQVYRYGMECTCYSAAVPSPRPK